MATTSYTLLTRKKITVRGTVQGVGFRPFIYNLAKEFGMAGHVFNSSAGVTIEIEGGDSAVHEFALALSHSLPPLSEIKEISITDIEATGEVGFAVLESRQEEGEFALVPPDVATCNDCWHDFGSPADRRFGYAFTNCTNCGPRFTIIQDMPYDRRATAMSSFQMCERCEAEYQDPSNRRFHAQPNACPSCGPGLALVKGGAATGDVFFSQDISAVRRARQLLREGLILAVKGFGGFLLACDAENDGAVRLLRQRKLRSDKPFALMVRDLEAVESFCEVSEMDRGALTNQRRPIVVLPRRNCTTISDQVAPGNNTIGVMLPYTPLHYLLFSDSPYEQAEFTALVMTSGNISEEPIVVSNEDALERLGPVADWFLLHNREIYTRVDDSVVRTFEGRERVFRRSRGFVPQPIDLSTDLQEILAVGAELKNTLCLTKGHYAILSQHIGDLENYETLMFFQETVEKLKKLFRVAPKAIAYDLHPQYMSSRFAQSLEVEHKIGVQHHHAHIASCMAENHLSGKVIGVAFDGTGYGTDGQIWGGEFLVADFAGFERQAHFRYVPLPGGDAAVRQPWRMALSYLRDTFGIACFPESLGLLRSVPSKQVSIVDAMLARRINTVQTSSCGRLFDAVASLIGLRHEINFEGQAAIDLEMVAQGDVDGAYPFDVEGSNPMQVDMRATIRAIVQDISRSKPISFISSRFHDTMAAVMVEVCRRIRESERLNRVCLSGGTFQNMYLLRRGVMALRQAGFEVFLHATVPPNDGGVSLGQVVIASEVLRRGDQSCV